MTFTIAAGTHASLWYCLFAECCSQDLFYAFGAGRCDLTIYGRGSEQLCGAFFSLALLEVALSDTFPSERFFFR